MSLADSGDVRVAREVADELADELTGEGRPLAAGCVRACAASAELTGELLAALRAIVSPAHAMSIDEVHAALALANAVMAKAEAL